MSTLLPQDLWPIIGSAALFAVCVIAVYRDRALWPLALVMVANWMGTRAVTSFHLAGSIQGVVDLSAAAGLILLRRVRPGLAPPVAALFALMVAFSAGYDLGLIGRNTLWAWSDVLGYCQLLLILGAAAASGGGGRLALDTPRGSRDLRLGRPLARWLSGPPTA